MNIQKQETERILKAQSQANKGKRNEGIIKDQSSERCMLIFCE